MSVPNSDLLQFILKLIFYAFCDLNELTSESVSWIFTFQHFFQNEAYCAVVQAGLTVGTHLNCDILEAWQQRLLVDVTGLSSCVCPGLAAKLKVNVGFTFCEYDRKA